MSEVVLLLLLQWWFHGISNRSAIDGTCQAVLHPIFVTSFAWLVIRLEAANKFEGP